MIDLHNRVGRFLRRLIETIGRREMLLVLLALAAHQASALPELFMDWEGQRMLSVSSERCQVFVDR
jgi:hypothetical protein